MLPWIVTGRISASERQRLERHLLECGECREELEQQRALCEHVRRDESVMLAPQASLQKLMARIDASVSGHNDATGDSKDDSSGDFLDTHADVASTQNPPARRKVPLWIAVAAAVQTLAIAALLTLIWQQRQAEMSAPRFATLSNATVPLASGAVLRVVFKPEMTNAQLQSLVQSVGAQVVSGPTEAGVYTLLLARGQRGGNVALVLEQVRANPAVIFAEHVSKEAQP